MKKYILLVTTLFLFAPLLAQEEKSEPAEKVPEAPAAENAAEAPAAEAPAAEAPENEKEFSDLPPAKPGECYIRTQLPAQFEIVKQKVMVKPASTEVAIVPAVYTQVVEKVKVAEGYTRFNVIEASFDLVDVKVQVQPAGAKLVEVPPEYKEIEEEVIVKPAQQVWKRGDGLRSELAGGDTSALMCLVTIPAETMTVKRLVEVKPARTDEVETPPEYMTVKQRVVLKPASVEEEWVPPVFEDRLVRILLDPPQRKVTEVAAVIEEVDTKIQISPERMGWTRVLCDTNLNPPILMDIQDALKAKGYDCEGERGTLGKPLVTTVKKYCTDNNLASGLTYDLLKNLGVKAPEDRIAADTVNE